MKNNNNNKQDKSPPGPNFIELPMVYANNYFE